MPEETAESPQKTQKKPKTAHTKKQQPQRNSKNRKQHTQKQQHPKKQQKQHKKQPLKKKYKNTKTIYKHTPNKFWYHQHNIQHTRHYNCNHTGVDTHIYKCIDKRQYSDIVSCKYGSIATRIGDCVCQT